MFPWLDPFRCSRGWLHSSVSFASRHGFLVLSAQDWVLTGFLSSLLLVVLLAAWNQQQSGGISGGGRIWPAAQVPAPWGSEIVAARVPKKVLQFVGIDDVFTSSRGSTKV